MNLSPVPVQKFFGNDGRPLNGGLLFTYVAGTVIKIATYTDSTGGTQNTNPIVLNYRGEANVWIDPALTYKFVLAPANDTDPPTKPIWSVDNIKSADYSGLTAAIIGQILWPRTDAEIAAAIVPANYAYQTLLPQRYGGIGDGAHASADATAWAAWRSVMVQSTTLGSQWNIWSREDPLSTAIGFNALKSEVAGSGGTQNTVFGHNVMALSNSSIRNTVMGADSMIAATSAYENTVMGAECAQFLTTGTRNTIIGNRAMGLGLTIESESTAIGSSALFSANAAKNTAVGREAGYYITTGLGNTVMGYDSMLGDAVLKATGDYNCFYGYQSGLSCTTATRNVGVGFQALAIDTTGQSNVCLGYASGSAITTGSFNVILGGNTGTAIATLSNRVIISDGAGTSRLECDQNGKWSFFKPIAILNGAYFVGNATNGYTFNNGADTINLIQVSDAGSVRFNTYGAGTLTTNGTGVITAVSDVRAKDVSGPFTRGLAEILALDPILYRWKKGSPMYDGLIHAGFGAQDVLPHVPEAVYGNEENGYTFSDRPIIAALVNAIKELDARTRLQ